MLLDQSLHRHSPSLAKVGAKSQSSSTLPAQEKLFVPVKRWWRASSSTACFAEVRANPLTLTFSPSPSPQTSRVLQQRHPSQPCSHCGTDPAPAAQAASNQGLGFWVCASNYRGVARKSCRIGQQSFPLCWKPKAATPVTGMRGMFCFTATAGREGSRARQPSTESFAGKKITYTGWFSSYTRFSLGQLVLFTSTREVRF